MAAGIIGQRIQLGDSDAKAEANQDSAATGLEAHITSSHSSLGAKDHVGKWFAVAF